MLTNEFIQYASQFKHRGLHRVRRVSGSGSSKDELNFSSNDYLSLGADPCLKKAYQRGFERYPTGSGGSMLVCGYHATHKALETAFKDALEVDDCLLFTSGYAANLSVMGLLGKVGAHVLLDKGVHASVYDGLTLARVAYSRYQHNNLANLANKLKAAPQKTVLVTESIFSMSGQCAPLAEISQLAKAYSHDLIVDEAHAFGVIGYQGLGAVLQQGLTQAEVPLRVIPMGKAGAAFGAVVAGQSAWVDALLQSARPHTYSTSISPAFTYGLIETLERIRGADDRRAKLVELIRYFRGVCSQSPLTWRDSTSPIQQLQLGCPHQALHYSEKLRERGIICLPIRQPTVSKQETGLRVILNYHHEPEQIDYLFKCLL